MDYLPIFVALRGRRVLVVGGGSVALRKAALLARAAARVQVVAPDIVPALRELAEASGGRCLLESFDPSQLQGVALAFAATDDPATNRAVHAAARAAGIAVNVADAPALCDFILPSIVDRDPVLIAIATAGTAPLLARRLRARIETQMPAALGRLARYLGGRRALIGARVPEALARLRLWERVVDGAIAERVLAGDEAGADRLLEQALLAAPGAVTGEVYLVGAGPGDPDLLSFRALRLMQNCDVVLHDRLVSAPILDLVRREAERIYVGKRRGEHALPQPDINALLVQHARQGRRVLRLKGGDPFIFGRGGEEIEHLAAAGIPFQVVPGITAASGCAAYAGIPLTHRDHAQSVRFVAGHLRDGQVDLNWPDLVRERETLVFYMGLLGLPVICRELIAHGMDPAMPVALIQQGTLPQQRVLVSTLAEMPAALAIADFHGPTITIVGRVVELRGTLDWFGH